MYEVAGLDFPNRQAVNIHPFSLKVKIKIPTELGRIRLCLSLAIATGCCYNDVMVVCLLCFLLGSILGLLASEFADRWGCSQRYRSALPKKLFIVLMSGIGAAGLYCWEVQNQMLVPLLPDMPLEMLRHIRIYIRPQDILNPSTPGMAQVLYHILIPRLVLHLIFFSLLLAATLTDFYEMIIPDSITVVGTFTALFAALFFLYTALPVTEIGFTKGGTLVPDGVRFYKTYPMHIWSPNPTGACSLIIMTLLWWFWCFAMLDRVWYSKLPLRKAQAIFWRYLYRSPRTKYIIAAAVIMPLVFAWKNDGETQTALYSALTGMATGMILIWAVRLTSRWVLGMEAMGFGDVTLMGMIGAFLGWQAVLLIFFAAPFFGLIYGMINLLLGRGRAVPYGPFLCLATVVVVITWSPIWSATAEFFAFGIGTIGLFLLVLLMLFAGLLHVVHKIMSGLQR